MHRSDINFEEYAACSRPRYQSIDGTMKQCLVFRDEEGTLYLAPKADMLKQKEVVRETCAAYALVYNKPYSLGNVYTRETVNTACYEKMKQMEIIVDYIVEIGVLRFSGISRRGLFGVFATWVWVAFFCGVNLNGGANAWHISMLQF